MEAWRPHMMHWSSLGFQIKLRLFEKLSFSGQMEFTGPRTMTDTIKCFISEISQRRRDDLAAVDLYVWGSRAPKDPWPPSLTAQSLSGDILISAEAKARRFRLFLFIECDPDHRFWGQNKSLWTLRLTSGATKHSFPPSFCLVAAAFIWLRLSF